MRAGDTASCHHNAPIPTRDHGTDGDLVRHDPAEYLRTPLPVVNIHIESDEAGRIGDVALPPEQILFRQSVFADDSRIPRTGADEIRSRFRNSSHPARKSSNASSICRRPSAVAAATSFADVGS